MQTQTPANEPSTQSPTQPKDISDPTLSFTEYQALRSGQGAKPEDSSGQSAPASEKKPEQKKSPESDTAGKEAKEVSHEGDTESDAESDEGDTEGKDKTKKQSGGWQRRIDKKTREAAEAARERDYWKAQALQAAAAAKPQSQETAPQKTETQQAKPRPQVGDFKTFSEYETALDAWHDTRIEAKLSEREQKQKQTEAQKAQEAVARTFADKVKSFAEKTKDFHDVIAAGQEDGMFVSQAMHEAILESEQGPALFYELAKNPEESQRIAQLSVPKQLIEMGKIEARIASTPKASQEPTKEQPNKITQAPKPPEPVSGGKGSVAKDITDPSLPFPEYVKLRREQLRRRRA